MGVITSGGALWSYPSSIVSRDPGMPPAMILGWLALGACSAPRAHRLAGWHGFVRVEEGDGGGFGGGPLPVCPFNFQVVARVGEFRWHPNVADVALQAW